ncbi:MULTISPECIES: hypothetical protein [unclassified Rathayibacter]|uniref:hypothetical protein n=1 Tax=unclassified Rathayibacter TaxID=2609250 RepID=UPI001FC9283B|nr:MULTISPECIES: hypothetical protein [unclassified Rathayibacter]
MLDDGDSTVSTRQAGVQAELHVWPGAFHGFTSMMPGAELSRTAVSALAGWTTRLLSGRP